MRLDRGFALAGLAVVAAHAAGYLALAPRTGGTELAVTVSAPLASATLTLDGVVPDGLRDRVTIATEGTPPGLVRRTWQVDYRGGFTREVGAAQLVGPFQDPASHACTGRVIVGQQLLDDGAASPGTIAHAVGAALHAQLAGLRITALGDYERIDKLALRWARLGANPADVALVGGASGYVRITLTLVFERVKVPLVVTLVPRPRPTALDFALAVRAELDFGNRVLQWASDHLGGDALATRFARREVNAALIAALEPPPPLELGRGTRLVFGYCDGPFEVEADAWGALPFRVRLAGVPGVPAVLPPRQGPGPRAPVAPGTRLAVDLELDALNAMLYEVWRAGFLDHELATAGLAARFNTDPIVTEFLSLRISDPVLALPPVLAPGPTGLRIAADARITVADGPLRTVGRVWGAVDLAVAAGAQVTPVAAELGALELACADAPGAAATLRPCYAELVAAVRARAADFHEPLTRVVGSLLDVLADRELGDPSVPGVLVIERVHPALVRAGRNATLRLSADARVVLPR